MKVGTLVKHSTQGFIGIIVSGPSKRPCAEQYTPVFVLTSGFTWSDKQKNNGIYYALPELLELIVISQEE